MNESIITPHSTWRVMRPPNRTEADQVSKREGVYTMLELEQFIWTYYYQRQPLGDANSQSTKLCAMADENYFPNNFCATDVSFIAHQSGSYMVLEVCIPCDTCGDQVSKKRCAI
jgi:hypothetical protein